MATKKGSTKKGNSPMMGGGHMMPGMPPKGMGKGGGKKGGKGC